MRPHLRLTALNAGLALCLAACSAGAAASPTDSVPTRAASATAAAPATAATSAEAEASRPAGWSEASHGNAAEPNYTVVFPANTVNALTITIAPADWAAMQANLTELLGEPGAGGGPGQPAGGLGGPRQAGGDMTPANPIWVEATVTFAGQTWTHVGVRYKGNSSLTSAWRSGDASLPLKLDFDEFEDAYPEIENQRFFGFKQLALNSNFGDATGLRETVAYDLLAAAGLPAAETAFYNVVVDYGEGPVELGLYTAVEVIDDTVVDRVFGDDSGNIYEADGAGVSLAAGTLAQIPTSFQKENNAAEADWTDLEALYNALHSDLRTTDPAAWRAQLDALFDTDGFLKWLALSAVLQHWDTYGSMTHNFYLYDDPASGKLTWISWDHNFILGAGPGGAGGGPAAGRGAPPGQGVPGSQGGLGGQGGPGGGRGSVSLDKADVGENWPLIRYLLDDPVYAEQYYRYLGEIADEVFDADALAAQYQTLAAVIAPSVDDSAAFETAVQQLTETTYARAETVRTFLADR